ncbi:MAG: response regulator [Terriglobia bacterium]
MKPKRVLLADDHTMFLEGLEKLLAPQYEIVAKVQDGHALVEAAKALRPDVIVTDISMPHLNGIQAARQIKEAGLDASIVLLTMHDEPEYAMEALQHGVSGYVVKHAISSELLMAIEEALAGRMYVTPHIAKDVFEALAAGNDRPWQRGAGLSLRQRGVLQLLTEGLSAKQIAHRLNISKRTVEHHKYRMMRQLNVSTTAALIQYAVKHGLVS